MSVTKRFNCERSDNSFLHIEKIMDGIFITITNDADDMEEAVFLTYEDVRHLIVELENKLEELK